MSTCSGRRTSAAFSRLGLMQLQERRLRVRMVKESEPAHTLAFDLCLTCYSCVTFLCLLPHTHTHTHTTHTHTHINLHTITESHTHTQTHIPMYTYTHTHTHRTKWGEAASILSIRSISELRKCPDTLTLERSMVLKLRPLTRPAPASASMLLAAAARPTLSRPAVAPLPLPATASPAP